MGMTPDQFFETFVDPNAIECLERPGCVRRAFNAALAASHLADQYFAFHKRHSPELVAPFARIGGYVAHLTAETQGAFRDIRSIANAFKHLYTDIDERKAVHSSVSSSGAIESMEFVLAPYIEAIAEGYSADRGEPKSYVVFTRKDGTTSEFLPVLEKVVEYWRAEIYRA